MGSISEKPTKKPWIETPLVESTTLSRAAGCRIFLKLENLQPSSSFKSRGIGNLILTQIAHHRSIGSTRPLHFYSSSGGNAGLAAVTAATSLGYRSSVVVPTSTNALIIAKLKAAGASEVISHGASWFNADQHLRTVVIPRNTSEEGIYIPPFDHPDIWSGAASMIDEIHSQLPDCSPPDAIVCSVGGGGLFCGIMQGLDRVGWSSDDVKVLAVETRGADSLAESLRQGHLATLPGITSIAKTLGAVTVARKAFENAQRKNVRSCVIEDAEACMGCWRLADDERILVEPACGASVALCYGGRLQRYLAGLTPESKVVVIVCGGSTISLDILMKYREEYGPRIEEMRKERETGREVPSTHTAP